MCKSFTLIELIIYVALTVIILNVGIYFTWQVIESKMKINAYQEVGRNVNFVLEKISFEGKRAKSLIVPNFLGEETNELLLMMPDGQKIKIYLLDNRIVLDNDGQINFLTSNKVEIDRMIFKNVSSSFPGSFQIILKINYKNSEGRGEREAMVELQKTINLRDN
ncbi:MAG: hypothetical protein KGZ97_03605 [Bacteroidetes bacterium]|nr:hypothetical protein [Bacteroidota bacterium]